MFYGKLIDSLGFRFKELDVTKNSPDNRAMAGFYVNQASKWIYESHPWEPRRKHGEIVQIPNYTSGTCTVTVYDGTNEAASRTVTFSSALPSGLAGRFFQVQGESDWHRILYTTGSTAYLESPIIKSTGTSFKIWKRFYYLPSNVGMVTEVGKWDGSGRLEYKSPEALHDMVTDISQDGTPNTFTPFGNDDFSNDYSTGTVTISAGTNVALGAGTVWIGNVGSGDILTINNKPYRVKRVETDTRLLLHNYIETAITLSAYTITKDITLGLQLFPNEDAYRVIPYTFLDKQFDMVHETLDKPNLPDRFDEAILTRAEMMILKDQKSNSWTTVSQLLMNQMEELKSKKRPVQTRNDQFAPKIYSGMPGRDI
jgi:hypothetical protein